MEECRDVLHVRHALKVLDALISRKRTGCKVKDKEKGSPDDSAGGSASPSELSRTDIVFEKNHLYDNHLQSFNDKCDQSQHQPQNKLILYHF